MDKDLSETIEYYKDCLGIETTVRLLCDDSYIRYLAARYNDPRDLHCCLPEENNPHGDIIRMFGVKYVALDTTKCVLAKLRGMCGLGVASIGMEHAVSVALHMRCFVCDHHDRSINADECIQSVVRRSVHEPYIVASVNKVFYTNIQELTGVPILTFIEGRKTILPLKESHKSRLDFIKQMRIPQVEVDRLEKVEENMEKNAVEEKEKAANKAFEKNKRSNKAFEKNKRSKKG